MEPEKGKFVIEGEDANWGPIVCGDHSNPDNPVGYQPDCEACQQTAKATTDHIRKATEV